MNKYRVEIYYQYLRNGGTSDSSKVYKVRANSRDAAREWALKEFKGTTNFTHIVSVNVSSS